MQSHERILDFWFGAARHDLAHAGERVSMWFGSDGDVDATLRNRFGKYVESAVSGGLTVWSSTPAGRLALILLLDQFTRNVYRGTAAAYSGDDRALALAQTAVARGEDGQLGPLERAFVYMPFEHSESLAVQLQSVALFSALADAVPIDARSVFDSFVAYAKQHCEIVARFGRFPHRNAILGRESTPEEREYLAGGAPGFGQ